MKSLIQLLKTAGKAVACVLAAGMVFNATFAQETLTNDKPGVVKHVKLEVGQNGLHCPFLGMAVKEKIRTTKEFSNLYVDKQDLYLTFTCPASRNLTEEDVVKLAYEVGYPKDLIRVTISDKPFLYGKEKH